MEFKFKYIREKNELKQHEIAKIIGISRSNYSLIESEKANIKLKVLLNYCNKLNYSMDYISNLTNTNELKYINMNTKICKETISKRLKELEKDKGVKANEIVNLLGIQKSTYSSYKSLKCNNIIQTLMLKEIAKHYGYSMDWLVGRSNKKYISK